jgi:hypothetical protein
MSSVTTISSRIVASVRHPPRLGVIHAWIEGPGDQYGIGQNNSAFNVRGGVIYSLNTRVGLRGDLRYFRAFVDESKREGGYVRDYGFVRATVGVTIGLRAPIQ